MVIRKCGIVCYVVGKNLVSIYIKICVKFYNSFLKIKKNDKMYVLVYYQFFYCLIISDFLMMILCCLIFRYNNDLLLYFV